MANIMRDCFREYASNKNCLIIPFDKIFDEDISFVNTFHLNKKRGYINILDDILDSNNDIIKKLDSNAEDVLYNYMALKYAIDAQNYKSENEFIKQMKEYIIDDIKETIINHVEENYHFNLDASQADNSAKYKASLQFTDRHNKLLFQISTCMKFCIPLILHYAYIYNIDEIGQYILRCYDPIFETFNDNGKVDILNKLYESVYSRTIVTRYSDRIHWFYNEIQGIRIEGLTEELVKKLITDIVPKYKFDQNPISLNHVAIQKNISYAFMVNFPLSFKSMNIAESTSNDNDISDFERLSVNTARINEAELCINTVNIKQTIKSISKKLGITVDKDEVRYYLKNFKINKLQRNLIFLFYAKYFGSTNSLYYCNVKEYVMLMVLMKKYLEMNNFTYLNKILSATVESVVEKKTLNKKNLTKVVESDKYNLIIANNYSDSMFNILDSNAILKFVATLINNTFIINEYNGNSNGEELEINHDVVSDELLRIIAMI